MLMKDRAKIVFADTLEKMLTTMPLDKVRVSRLCEACGTTTPTFYYYFHDKYELVAWMFLQDFAGEFGDREPEYTAAGLNALTMRMKARKTFYQKAFDDQSQNSIAEYVQGFNIQIAVDAVMHATGKNLSDEQLLAVKYHVYGIMGVFHDWLFSDSLTTEQMTAFLYERTPNFLKEAFSLYPYSTDNILQRAGKQTKKI